MDVGVRNRRVLGPYAGGARDLFLVRIVFETFSP